MRLPAMIASLLGLPALLLGIGQASARPAADRPTVAVTTGAEGSTVRRADGSPIAELPWLLPGDRDLEVAPDGRHLVFVSERDGNPELYVADAAGGAPLRLTFNPQAADVHPSWSPDGRTIAWESVRPGLTNIHLMAADGKGKRRLVFGGGANTHPAWSPDGTEVAFGSDRDGFPGLWSTPASGGEPALLHHLSRPADGIAWHPRRGALAVGSGGDIWEVVPSAGSLRRLVAGPPTDSDPSWSPDGTRLAFGRASRGTRSLVIARGDGTSLRVVAGGSGETAIRLTAGSPLLAPPSDAALPDLDQRVPTDLIVRRLNGRWAVGFTSNVENIGDGALVIHGRRAPGAREMVATQVIERRLGGSLRVSPVGRLAFEAHPPHRHWHLQPFERYELRSVANRALVLRDRKSGFCLIDRYGQGSLRRPPAGKPRFTGDCATLRPDASRVVEGSSPGYRDRYPAFFHGQDIEIQGLPAGLYVLVHEANPERLLRETSYANNAASVLVRLTWPDGRDEEPSVEVVRRCEASSACLPRGR